MSPPTFDPFRCDPDNWKLGCIYFCPADRRVIVPKRMRGFGWTLNFARPLALPFLVFMIALLSGVVGLVHALAGEGEVRAPLAWLLGLGVIALCYRLAHRPPAK